MNLIDLEFLKTKKKTINSEGLFFVFLAYPKNFCLLLFFLSVDSKPFIFDRYAQ